MSQANSLLRTYEFQEKNINSPRFERLFQLIERGQNLLFEKEFSQFNDKINNKLQKTGDTLLIQAVRYANEPIIEFLINQGCDLNAQNYLGNTALHIAFLNNNLNIVNTLICCGAKEFILNNNGLTPWESRKQYYK
jgi:ankyrin repeat protein